MKITFLGTGTSQGVPLIACQCEICSSTHAKDKRLRSSIYIEIENKHLVIDTGPDFRQQMLRENIKNVDAILFTHSHKDHIAGLDDIRAFNYIHNKAVDVYCTDATLGALKKEFAYIFDGTNYPGIPQINVHKIFADHSFSINDILVTTIPVLHYKMPVLGFRINNFAYITDANYIADEEITKLKGIDILVLNALRLEKHISHFTLAEAMAIAQKIGAKKTYFTHISHQLGLHEEVNTQLPPNIELAYDGLQIQV